MNKPVQEQLDFKPSYTEKLSFMYRLKDYAKTHNARQIFYRFDFRKIGANLQKPSSVYSFLEREGIPFKKMNLSKKEKEKKIPYFAELEKYAPHHTIHQIVKKFHFKSTCVATNLLLSSHISWLRRDSKKYARVLRNYIKDHSISQLVKEFGFENRGSACSALRRRGISFRRINNSRHAKRKSFKRTGESRSLFIKKLRKYAPYHTCPQVAKKFHLVSISSARNYLDKNHIPYIKLTNESKTAPKSRSKSVNPTEVLHSLKYWKSLLHYAYNESPEKVLKHFSYKNIFCLFNAIQTAHRKYQESNKHTLVGKTKNLVENVNYYKLFSKYECNLCQKMKGKYGILCRKYKRMKNSYDSKIKDLKSRVCTPEEKQELKECHKMINLISKN